jgi:hypothetical protein
LLSSDEQCEGNGCAGSEPQCSGCVHACYSRPCDARRPARVDLVGTALHWDTPSHRLCGQLPSIAAQGPRQVQLNSLAEFCACSKQVGQCGACRNEAPLCSRDGERSQPPQTRHDMTLARAARVSDGESSTWSACRADEAGLRSSRCRWVECVSRWPGCQRSQYDAA